MKYSKAFSKLFWSRVKKTNDKDGCWNWTLGLNDSGYGQLTNRRVSKFPLRAHRVAWELTSGDIPAGKCVLHDCDNRKCCRPSHLFLGTRAVNIRDCAAKGRTPRGEKHWSVKVPTAVVRKIRKRVASGESQAAVARSFRLSPKFVNEVVHKKRRKYE